MRFLALLCGLVAGVPAYAQQDVLGDFLTQEAQGNSLARVQVKVLEFATNQLTTMDLTAGQPDVYGDLTLLLQGCRTHHADVVGQDVAWLEITPVRRADAVTEAAAYESIENEQAEHVEGEDSAPVVPLFKGWMFNTLTDVSTLDHPKYDVRLMKCLPDAPLPVVVEEILEVSATVEVDVMGAEVMPAVSMTESVGGMEFLKPADVVSGTILP